MRDDSKYLQHISESISLIEDDLAGADGSPDQRFFNEDQRTQDAVLRRMETLTDAASHLSEELKRRYPQIPRRKIADFRNAMAHAYVNLKPNEVWAAIINDLPELRIMVEIEIQRLGAD